MTLTAKDVAEITRLLEDSSFDELYLELDGMKLTLRRSGAPATTQSPPRPPDPAVQATPAGAARQAQPPGAAPARAPALESAPGTQAVTAPLLGTFYRAPKPGAPPFVEVGSQVEEETLIGIIEVMKLMNTVRAGIRGEVLEILARDGVLVEYGEPLLKVKVTS